MKETTQNNLLIILVSIFVIIGSINFCFNIYNNWRLTQPIVLTCQSTGVSRDHDLLALQGCGVTYSNIQLKLDNVVILDDLNGNKTNETN